MEKLKTYLVGRTKKDFAQQVGIVPAYLSQILSGDKVPSFSLMVRIQIATNKKVSVGAWVIE